MGEEEVSEEELRRDFGKNWAEFLETVHYPPVSARRKPAWMVRNGVSHGSVPDPVKELMDEIYIALQSGSRRLVAMGIRTALDQIMRDKVGEHRSFPKYLDAFQAAHYISQRQRNVLQTIIEAGSASAHRSWRPSDSDISALLDITENVIETLYIHEPRAEELAKKVPRWKPNRGSEKH